MNPYLHIVGDISISCDISVRVRGADESEGTQRGTGQIGPGGDSRLAFIVS